jgi:hypothetical protein
LEVRRCGDGHPPVTERERVIRLNGIGGVTFENPDRKFDPGFLLGWRGQSLQRSQRGKTVFLFHAPTNLKIHAHH